PLGCVGRQSLLDDPEYPGLLRQPHSRRPVNQETSMVNPLVYTTGTVACTNGSATVTGTATGWQVALITGGMFSAAGRSIPIEEVVSDTELTLAYPWTGPDHSGLYAIARGTSESV